MPKTNITKFVLFVILALTGSFVISGCGGRGDVRADRATVFGAPVQVGSLRSPELVEASGVAASKCQSNVYWAHNDSGGDTYLFAIDGSGSHLGVWRVGRARNRDWEDIAVVKDAAGKCFVLIGDIGNNELQREELAIYRVGEPAVDASAAASARSSARDTEPAEVLYFKYPGAPRDAETLLADPTTGDLYVLTKSEKDPVTVYKLAPEFSGAMQEAQRISEFTLPAVPHGFLTGGDISPDGRHVVLCDYINGYELSLPALSTDFDEIWKQRPLRFDLGDRSAGEAVTYSQDGGSILAISEDRGSPVFRVDRK